MSEKLYVPKVGERVRVRAIEDKNVGALAGKVGVAKNVNIDRRNGLRVLLDGEQCARYFWPEHLEPIAPAHETRPPCDACGAESCDSKSGSKRVAGHIGEAFLGEDIYFCKDHWSDGGQWGHDPHGAMRINLIRSRRAALAEKKEFKVGDWVSGIGAGNPLLGRYFGELTSLDFDGECLIRGYRDDVPADVGEFWIRRDSLRHETRQPEAKPPSPEATKKPDPYRDVRSDLELIAYERNVAASQSNADAARLARITPKQRQALSQLMRPLPSVKVDRMGRRVEEAHPKAWPAGSFDDVDELGSA